MREITLDATIENIEHVTEFVNEELERLGCPPKVRMKLDIAIDEIFCNISRYAYGPLGGQATVRLGFDKAEGIVTLSFIDSGVPFDPLTAPEPDISLALEDRPIGGLGLFMVRKMMDAVEYHHDGKHNVLTLRKRI